MLIPALLKGVGTWLTGKGNANKANAQSQYEVDQARRDYEAQRALSQEQDQRKLDAIDFLQAVAQGKGYNIPPAAFEALKRRGAYAGMSATDRIATPPKQGSSVWGALGSGVGLLSDMLADKEKNSLPPGSYAMPGGKSSGYTWDGGRGAGGGAEDDILAYYKSLLPGGGDGEVSVSNSTPWATYGGGA